MSSTDRHLTDVDRAWLDEHRRLAGEDPQLWMRTESIGDTTWVPPLLGVVVAGFAVLDAVLLLGRW